MSAGLCALVLLAAAAASPSSLPTFTEKTAEAGITFSRSFGDHDLSNIVEGTGSGRLLRLRRRRVAGHLLPQRLLGRRRSTTTAAATCAASCPTPSTATTATARSPTSPRRRACGDKGFGFGCSAADFDGDGDLDLYVLNYGPNVFYRNNGDGTFTDVSEKSGLDDPRWSLLGPLVRLRRRRRPGRLRGQLPGVRRGQVPVVLRRGRLPGPAELQRPARRPVPQQRRRHLHRRDRGGRAAQPRRPRDERRWPI